MAVLTLRTLRVGFPTAHLVVWGNDLGPADAAFVAQRAREAGGRFRPLPPQRHDLWMAWRIDQSPADELVLLDGDLVFHRDVEALTVADLPLQGPFEPAHFNDYTQAQHQERLHTCFWRLNPARVRAAIAGYRAGLPPIPHPTPWHPTAQTWIAGWPTQLLDSGCQLVRVLGGAKLLAFAAGYDDAFTHLQCGSWSELLADTPSLAGLPQMHARAVAGELTEAHYADIRARMRQWYADHALPPTA